VTVAKPPPEPWVADLLAELGLRRLPRWIDYDQKDEVTDQFADLVTRQLNIEARADEYDFAVLPWETHPGIPATEILEEVEREAVHAFEKKKKRGPLADLLDPENPMNKHPVGGVSLRSHLSDATWKLIGDVLSGRRKSKRGKPEMTADERRDTYAVHEAADDVEDVARILRGLYPEQDEADIRDRALAVAADRADMSKPETIATHRRRSKKGTRRLPK
jgi:hypothetical protein